MGWDRCCFLVSSPTLALSHPQNTHTRPIHTPRFTHTQLVANRAELQAANAALADKVQQLEREAAIAARVHDEQTGHLRNIEADASSLQKELAAAQAQIEV
jgi:hypothetical protein